MKSIYVGPAGWNYRDWEGIVYPPRSGKNFDALSYLSHFFNTIEVNSSFYRPPAVATTRQWVARVKANPDFKFCYKLWQAYTHQWEAFPAAGEEKTIKQGLDQLQSHDRLGALLIQFPWSFKNIPENRRWLEKVIRLFQDYHPVVELRHGSWHRQEFFSFLRDTGAGFVNIDQPVIGNSMRLTSFVSGTVGYLRLHGRNVKNWFADDADVASRYDYLYDEKELKNIGTTISNLIEQSPKIFIIFNNHFRGQAVVNALQVMFLLQRKQVNAPASLVEAYPQLKNWTKKNYQQAEQTSLF